MIPTQLALPGILTTATAFDWPGFEPFPAQFIGVSPFDASDSDKVRTYLNWSGLFQKWEIPVPFPQVLDDADWGATAISLLRDANALLDDFLTKGLLRPEVMFGVWRAFSEGDQVVIQSGDQKAVRIPFPRLPQPNGATYCLADFIKPAIAMKPDEWDYLGGYLIRLSADVLAPIRRYSAEPDDYQAFLATDLCVLYRSAVADYLHYRLRRFIWAYCDDDDLSNEDVLQGLHQGIRVDIGSPVCPDSITRTPLLQLLQIDDQSFTDNDPDSPASEVGGFFFAHPKSRPYPVPADDQPAL